MNDSNKMPVSTLVAESRRPNSTKDDEALAKSVEKEPKPFFINMSSAGKWKWIAITNYIVMYVLMGAVIVGDTSGLWHVQVNSAVLATFIGATIGSTIPLYLQFRVGRKSN